MTGSKNTLQQTQSKKFKILLIGDSCIDEYYYGVCDRLNPEAPVPVLKIISTETKFGMAENVRQNLLSFGCEVEFITGPNRSVKKRYIDSRSKQHIVRVDEDVLNEPYECHFDTATLEKFDAIVISDYCKGFLTYDNLAEIRKRYQGPIFMDTKKPDLAQFHGFFVKINETEYKNRYSINSTLIVTLGNRGAMYKTGRDTKYETIYPCPQVEVVDVCGAGDTFLAAFAYQYLNSQSIGTAIKFANQCAAITVQHRGVYSLTQSDIDSIVI